MFALVKFGGSVITDKKIFGKAREDVIERLCSEITIANKGIIVHGGGSFGHIKAVKYGFDVGSGNKIHFSEIHRDMIDLNRIVISSLLSKGIPAVSVPPHTFYPFGNLNAFKYYLNAGFFPVTYGDVYWKGDEGRIISGDDLMLMLAKKFPVDMAVFVSDVDGIYEDFSKKKILHVVTPEIITNLKIKEVGDATGGLRKKLETMFQIASLGIKTYIINGLVENNLRNLLKGKKVVGTEVRV